MTKLSSMIKFYFDKGKVMSELTIAQALRKIAKLKGEIAECDARIKAGVSYDKAKVPAFRFADQLSLWNEAKNEMLDLQARLSVANATTYIEYNGSKMLLAKAVRILEELKGSIDFFKKLSLRSEVVKEKNQEWNEEKSNYVTVTTETTFVSDLSEQDRDKTVKELKKQFDELNDIVENANHKTSV